MRHPVDVKFKNKKMNIEDMLIIKKFKLITLVTIYIFSLISNKDNKSNNE